MFPLFSISTEVVLSRFRHIVSDNTFVEHFAAPKTIFYAFFPFFIERKKTVNIKLNLVTLMAIIRNQFPISIQQNNNTQGIFLPCFFYFMVRIRISKRLIFLDPYCWNLLPYGKKYVFFFCFFLIF